MSLLPPRKPKVPTKMRPRKVERVQWLRYKRQQLRRMVADLQRELADTDGELRNLGYTEDK